MLLRLVIAPDSKLRTVSEPVVIGDEGDKDMLHQVLDSMVETCRHIQGLGLSAIQVGVPSRMFVVVTDDTAMHFINPEIIETSDNEITLNEGCLSFPGVFGGINRPDTVKVKYQNYELEDCELEATGMVARCILHEMDHLDGKLFTDYMGTVARDVALRKSGKAKKAINRAILQQAAAGNKVN
jgi:peptide deformylase